MSEQFLNFQMSGRLVFGAGARNGLAEIIRGLDTNAGKVFVVTDPGLMKAGLVDGVTKLLDDAGLAWALFSEIEPDPRIELVNDCLGAARSAGEIGVVLGLGGGSSLDIAKLVAILLRHEVEVTSLIGIGNVPGRGVPTIMMPTTAGTGSEVSSIAVLSDTSEHLKKGVVSEHLHADVALVDPELTLSLPSRITAYTGMDALTHCIEAFTNRYAHPFVDGLALEGIRLAGKSLRQAVHCGWEIAGRTDMALASLYGGLCLAPVNTAAIHAMAYPLGGTYNVPHGLANSVLLRHVMRFNLPANLEKHAAIAEALGEDTAGLPLRDAAELALRAVEQLTADVGMDIRLRDLGIPEDAIRPMAEGAVKVTRLMGNNPRVVTVDDAEMIYREAW